MTAVLLPNGKQQFFTAPGVPAVGYKLATFAAGTSAPQATWVDAGQIGANTNPIILDARGEAVIFWNGAYKVQLQDSTGAVIWTVDNLQAQPPNTPTGSQIPSVDNSFSLGSAAFSWANVFVGPNHAPLLDTVSGNMGYYARTAAEISAGVTPPNLGRDPEDIRRFGATGTGGAGTDDSAAFITKNTVGGRLRVTGQLTYRLSNNVTIGSTTALVIDEGSAISIDAGKTLTINGPFYSSATTPFVGAGSVVFAGLETRVYFKQGTIDYEAAKAALLLRGRVAPNANLNFFTSLFSLTGCAGPGTATILQDISDVFVSQFGAITGTGVSYVAPWGSDADTGANWKHAFLTIGQAVRVSVGTGIIYVWPGVYAPSDYRYTDAYIHPKRIIAPYGGVRVAYPGDDPTAATWTVNGTFGDIWQTTLATTNVPLRVLYAQILDKYGISAPLPLASPYGTVAATALAALNAVTLGWWYDTSTKILYVNLRGINVNTNALGKSQLSVVYGSPSIDNQFLILATTSYWENITFDAYPFVLNSAGQATPQFWAKNCTFRYSAANGITVQGGFSYTQGCTVYRSTADGANYDTLNAVTPLGIEINLTTRYAGDIDTFGTGAAQPNNPVSTVPNKNGSSAHTGSVVRVNGNHTDAYGPVVADSLSSFTWNVGVQAGYCWVIAGGNTRNGFYTAGASWYDGCAATGADSGYQSDTTGVVNIFNSAGSRVITSTGTISDYIPA